MLNWRPMSEAGPFKDGRRVLLYIDSYIVDPYYPEVCWWDSRAGGVWLCNDGAVDIWGEPLLFAEIDLPTELAIAEAAKEIAT